MKTENRFEIQIPTWQGRSVQAARDLNDDDYPLQFRLFPLEIIHSIKAQPSRQRQRWIMTNKKAVNEIKIWDWDSFHASLTILAGHFFGILRLGFAVKIRYETLKSFLNGYFKRSGKMEMKNRQSISVCLLRLN